MGVPVDLLCHLAALLQIRSIRMAVAFGNLLEKTTDAEINSKYEVRRTRYEVGESVEIRMELDIWILVD